MKRLVILGSFALVCALSAISVLLAVPDVASAQKAPAQVPSAPAPKPAAPAAKPMAAKPAAKPAARPVARAPARAGGPEILPLAGALGGLGLSAIGGGLYLRRRTIG